MDGSAHRRMEKAGASICQWSYKRPCVTCIPSGSSRQRRTSGRRSLSGSFVMRAAICWTPIIYANERSEEHTSELQSLAYLVCRLLLEKKNKKKKIKQT